MDRIKSWLKFVWNWITVIVASCAGLFAFLLQLADFLGGFDLSPFFGAEKALAISTGVAIAKGALSAIIAWSQKQDA